MIIIIFDLGIFGLKKISEKTFSRRCFYLVLHSNVEPHTKHCRSSKMSVRTNEISIYFGRKHYYKLHEMRNVHNMLRVLQLKPTTDRPMQRTWLFLEWIMAILENWVILWKSHSTMSWKTAQWKTLCDTIGLMSHEKPKTSLWIHLLQGKSSYLHATEIITLYALSWSMKHTQSHKLNLNGNFKKENWVFRI